VKAARVHRFRFTITVSTLAALLLLEVAPSYAATVAIVRPANPPPAMTETLVRLHGELTSVGFATEFIDGPGGDGMRGRGIAQLAGVVGGSRGSRRSGRHDGGQVTRFGRGLGHRQGDRKIGRAAPFPFEPLSAKGPETLAIQAVELLRASFLEIDLAMPERASQTMLRHRRWSVSWKWNNSRSERAFRRGAWEVPQA
jgi:hypothetical protein